MRRSEDRRGGGCLPGGNHLGRKKEEGLELDKTTYKLN